ncbi:MAG: hypothetical protein ABJM18_06875 [Hyphomonas sp.]|uniref:hypothetical protein n=1 Tax=Hyphomonas sp. TaxID=87 RepID=UPI00329A6133
MVNEKMLLVGLVLSMFIAMGSFAKNTLETDSGDRDRVRTEISKIRDLALR